MNVELSIINAQGSPARLWKETLRETLKDILSYREAAKVKVRRAIAKRTDDEKERKRLFTLLKYDRWTEDKYLRRMMRKSWPSNVWIISTLLRVSKNYQLNLDLK
jgi:hypothetical protein